MQSAGKCGHDMNRKYNKLGYTYCSKIEGILCVYFGSTFGEGEEAATCVGGFAERRDFVASRVEENEINI